MILVPNLVPDPEFIFGYHDDIILKTNEKKETEKQEKR